MPLDKSNSEADRIRIKREKMVYSNYLAKATLFKNGVTSRAAVIVSGTGASGESSAHTEIIVGEINTSPADQTTILAANVAPSRILGSILFYSDSYLTSGLSTDFSMGTSDFTVECWAKASQAIGGGWTNLVALGSAAGNDIRISAGGDFYAPNNGKIGFIVPNTGNSSDLRFRTVNTMTVNSWYHLALVRIGSTINFYINGVSQSFTNDANGTLYTSGLPVSFNHTGDVNGKSDFFVNNSLFNESQFNGLISNVRLVKGLGVYTGNFTVPTSPLSVVSGSIILLNTADSTNYLNDGSSYNHTLTTGGSPAYTSSNPFS